MNDKWRLFLQKLKNPRGWVLALVYAVTLLSIAGAMVILFVDYTGTPLEIVAYALFALAALTLAYSVYTIVLFIPKWRKSIIAWAERREFTRNLLRNFGFRTIVVAIGSFAMSILFGAFNGVLGILERSVWYGALAVYYIILAFIRGGVLLYHKNKRGADTASREYRQAKTYRGCGIWLVIVNTALSSAIAQMIFDDRSFQYDGLMIYATAAYAFYKITMSIINIFRAKKQDDLTVQAIRNVNLTDAAVSILALQTALLSTFNDGITNVSLFNTLTGSVVSLGTLALGILMVVKGNKRMKTLQTEKNDGQQAI
ncbi:MAG: hypothetical protein IJX91_01150 [Clostridia bacterium]|nr:hypothetical protein [Clostridia bacterium]